MRIPTRNLTDEEGDEESDKEGDKEEKCIPDKSNPNDYKCAKCVGDKDCKPDKPICAENECRKCMNDNECHYLPGEGLSIRKCLSTGKCGKSSHFPKQ